METNEKQANGIPLEKTAPSTHTLGMTSISAELLTTLTERARPHYSDTLPYHNWEHAREVMSAAAKIALSTTHPDIARNAHLLVIAAAWHDADFHLEDTSEFASKEERSAALAIENLPELSSEDRGMIASGIIDTTVAKTQKESVFGEALHLADLSYFAADHEHFMNRLLAMHLEWGNVRWDETVKRTLVFGRHVIDEAQKSAFEILPKARAEAWVENIQTNLTSLESKS